MVLAKREKANHPFLLQCCQCSCFALRQNAEPHPALGLHAHWPQSWPPVASVLSLRVAARCSGLRQNPGWTSGVPLLASKRRSLHLVELFPAGSVWDCATLMLCIFVGKISAACQALLPCKHSTERQCLVTMSAGSGAAIPNQAACPGSPAWHVSEGSSFGCCKHRQLRADFLNAFELQLL